MDLTQGSHQEKTNRAKKMMLWFGMLSMFMTFAGLTSAVIVSKSRPDWINNFEIPQALFFSTIAIVLSSVVIHFAKKQITAGNASQGLILLIITLFLGLAFVYFQFSGFNFIRESSGVHFTGPTSNVTTSFMYILMVLHLAHLVSGVIVLLVVIYNHYKQRYSNGKTLGLELGVSFWHFLDFLWVYLFLFFYFVR
ncbi:cytochrome c oxidase subunit 3 [Pseudofulvibacter geojedonensis]|uniref:Heme-copper oxidase subunit III n=1 Tax=Pseudofulvibacter geojedonensis TaxID=1123758 RepID=A0ABW3I1F7_9FLAO